MEQFCRNCGTQLIPGSAFCPNCGAKTVQTSPQAQPDKQRGNNRVTPPQPYRQPQQPYRRPMQPVQNQQPYRRPVQPVQNQQHYPQPQQPPQRQNGQKRSYFMMILTICLSVILVVEGVVAGLWYPGFLRFRESGENGQDGGTSTTAKILSDADYNIDYSEQEIADAPKTEMKIYADNTSAESGDFSVDFGAFNGMEDDTFTLRELPVHDFEKDGYSVQGYDFSLASGKHDFPGEVCIKLPRTEEDGDLVQFMSKDPDTGENERLYYEISGDGKSYLVYTTHFSQGVKVTKGGFGEKLKQDIATMDVSDPLTRDALGAFYYIDMDYFKGKTLLTTNVYFSRDELWKKVNNSTYLPLARDMTEAMVKASEGSSTNIDMIGLLLFDDETAGKIVGGVDAASNADTLIAETVKALSSGEIAEGATVASDICSHVSAITTVVGFSLNTDKAVKEVEDGKYDDMDAAAWGHWSDNLGTVVGIVGLAGAAFELTPVVIICAVGGLGLYCYSKATETPYDNLSQTELNYRDYLDYRFFYYDEPNKAAADNADGHKRGNIRRLTCLDDKQNRILKDNLGDKQGHIAGQDPRSSRSPDWSWLRVINGIYEATKDKPELLNTAVLEFYKNYTEACALYLKDKDGNKITTISEAEYLSFSRDAMEERGASRDAARLPTEEEMKAYTERMYKEMLKYHSPIFLHFAKYLSHQAELEVDKMIESELVPLLNTPMSFCVEDTSLKESETFEKSVYNVEPSQYQESQGDDYLFMGKYKDVRQYKIPSMEFCIHDGSDYSPVGPPKFYPSIGQPTGSRNNLKVTNIRQVSPEYYFPVEENFWPKLVRYTDNLVFECTYYHYLMMGAPNAMSFYDMKDDERYSDDFEIPKPDEKGRIRVNINIPGVEGSTEPEELWKKDAALLEKNGYRVDLRRSGLNNYEGVINAEKGSIKCIIFAVNEKTEKGVNIYYLNTEDQAAACMKTLTPYAFKQVGTRIVQNDQDNLIH